jgi:hypothetical protein
MVERLGFAAAVAGFASERERFEVVFKRLLHLTQIRINCPDIVDCAGQSCAVSKFVSDRKRLILTLLAAKAGGFLGHRVGYPTLAKGPARPKGNDAAAPKLSLLQRSKF